MNELFKLNCSRQFADVPAGGWPDSWIAYGGDMRDLSRDKGVHCYTDDRRFESLFNAPIARSKLVDRAAVVIAPDYSIPPSCDVPVALWQVWRSWAVASSLRWLARERSLAFVCVPTLQAGCPVEEVLAYQSLGIAIGSWVAVRTPGDAQWDAHHRTIVEYQIERVRPSGILAFGPRKRWLGQYNTVWMGKDWNRPGVFAG
jgi:hypothetical protein